MTGTFHVFSNVLITTKQLFEDLNFGTTVSGAHSVSCSIDTGDFTLGEKDGP